MRKKLFYSLVLALACMTASAQRIPAADLLDAQFNADGTATDVSAMKNPVEKFGTDIKVAYNDAFGRYVASFNNGWGGNTTSWFKVDYNTDGTNPNGEAIRNALADGHSLEMLLMGHYDGAIQDVEAKCFSAMQSGGTGFLVSKTNAAGSNGKNVFTFLPNVTESGSSTWRWCVSDVVPQSDIYYHVIGVWNKEEGKAYIYVNGELRNTIDAPGNFKFATSNANWFCMGGDPSGATTAHQGWTGDLVIARAYDKPLDGTEADALWKDVAAKVERANSAAYQNRPNVSLAPGTYQGEQTVTLSSKSYGTIYYTLDGSEPNDATGTLYTEPITLSASTVLKAIAVDDNDNPSEVTTDEYIFTTKKVYEYAKVTNMAELVNDGFYVMGATVDGSVKVATPLSATKTYGYLYVVDATETDGTLQLDSKDNEFCVSLTAQGARIKDIFGRYLQQIGTYNSFNVTSDDTAEGLLWGAKFNEDGTIIITNLNVNKYIQYSISYGSYGSYATEQTNAALPSLYIFKGVKYVDISEPDPTPTYGSIQELQEAATTTSTQIQLNIKNWYVSGVNGNQYFLTDGTGFGIVGYQKDHGFFVGDKLDGTVLCNLVLYKQLGEITDLTAANDGLVVTPGADVPAVTTAPGQLTGANQGALVVLNELYYEDGKLFDANGANVTPYNTFKIENMPTFEEGIYYNITGVVVIFNGAVEIAPLSVNQIEAVTISAEYTFPAGWSTFIAPVNLDIIEGFEAHIVDGADENGILILGTVNNIVPANTPVVIYAKETITVATNSIKIKPEANTVGLLTGVYEDTAAPTGSYVLQNLKGTVGFYQVVTETAPTVKAGHCYLTTGATVLGAKALTFGNATGIENLQMVNGEWSNGKCYDLSGRRVTNPTKGIFIVNGKKVMY